MNNKSFDVIICSDVHFYLEQVSESDFGVQLLHWL